MPCDIIIRYEPRETIEDYVRRELETPPEEPVPVYRVDEVYDWAEAHDPAWLLKSLRGLRAHAAVRFVHQIESGLVIPHPQLAAESVEVTTPLSDLGIFPIERKAPKIEDLKLWQALTLSELDDGTYRLVERHSTTNRERTIDFDDLNIVATRARMYEERLGDPGLTFMVKQLLKNKKIREEAERDPGYDDNVEAQKAAYVDASRKSYDYVQSGSTFWMNPPRKWSDKGRG